ncbi:unnamed protein product [Phytophthora lilii]|uniref:Unnamed protein product n=1 Tax=Phytophthora lilii TaxID=2077276 RepID=A0A9W7CPS1_9STRA|nr:unnamed protein product [Phytophthora lilii]
MTAADDNRRQTPVLTTDDASRSGNAPVSNAPVSTADGVGIREEAPVQTAGGRREAPTTTMAITSSVGPCASAYSPG